MRTPHTKPPGSWIIGIVLLVAVNGCAYYNTFYLAKRYYREGQRSQERSLSDTPSPDASQKYDATIRQCAKILVAYPKSKWVDDALYYMGAAMYGKGDYPGAIKKFGELRAAVPKSPYVPDSKLLEGISHYRRKEYVEAETSFREVETEFPPDELLKRLKAIEKAMAPGGHIGLFMGSRTLRTNWPQIGKWMLAVQRGR